MNGAHIWSEVDRWLSFEGWIVAAALLSVLSCALLSNYLVLRRLSLMGDAIAHAVLPGLAVAFLISSSRAAWPMFLGAVVAGTVTSLLTELIRRSGKVEHGAAMGVVFSVLFACGLLLIQQAKDLKRIDLDPECVLYGNINAVALEADRNVLTELFAGEIPPAVRNLALVLLLDAAFVALLYKELKITSFDPALASSLGIPAGALHYGLMIMVALTAVANFEAVGSILVIGMLIIPAATAHLLSDRLGLMICISLLVAALSAIGGYVLGAFGPGWLGLSSVRDVRIAPMIVVVAGLQLVVAILASPTHGLIGRAQRRMALALQIAREDILGSLYRYEELRGRHDPPMTRRQVRHALGDSWTTRWALARLTRRREVLPGADGEELQLSPQARRQGSQLVRGHRLWESYLARHSSLPMDHLHASAERVEHYLDPAMRAQLSDHLADVREDPHGKTIPEDDRSSRADADGT
jgi:manganese/zinc/iron transport system permease protein